MLHIYPSLFRTVLRSVQKETPMKIGTCYYANSLSKTLYNMDIMAGNLQSYIVLDSGKIGEVQRVQLNWHSPVGKLETHLQLNYGFSHYQTLVSLRGSNLSQQVYMFEDVNIRKTGGKFHFHRSICMDPTMRIQTIEFDASETSVAYKWLQPPYFDEQI